MHKGAFDLANYGELGENSLAAESGVRRILLTGIAICPEVAGPAVAAVLAASSVEKERKKEGEARNKCEGGSRERKPGPNVL